eukprot:NODE_11719_length_1269_cov_2.602452.p1 GENE.NODE_11719_length_1269_cov_2.602452~~NODE_11719_length_1269_cov_2.602452.p1  ORF type:complete len:287 (-),score=74.69 NODE_11719_length_1269_cov_2.602452:97-957(-)
MGDVGLYNAEHQTSVMPGKTHPEGLRWKLENWPLWLEEGVLRQIMAWPAADDAPAIRELLRTRYQRQLPHGVQTKISTNRVGSRRRILELFDGDEAFALSALSQTLLFRDILKPQEPSVCALRWHHGLGAGTFTVRGYWMAYHRNRSLPALDTATFCPGFVGALHGADALRLEEFTGVSLGGAGKTIAWDRYETQLRFTVWLYALRQYVERARRRDGALQTLMDRANFRMPMHFSELEASLCFMSRLVTMFEEPEGTGRWLGAARAIGNNISRRKLATLFSRLPGT